MSPIVQPLRVQQAHDTGVPVFITIPACISERTFELEPYALIAVNTRLIELKDIKI